MSPYFATVFQPNARRSTTGSPPGGVGRGRSAGQRNALAAGSVFGSGLTGGVKNEEAEDGRNEGQTPISAKNEEAGEGRRVWNETSGHMDDRSPMPLNAIP